MKKSKTVKTVFDDVDPEYMVKTFIPVLNEYASLCSDPFKLLFLISKDDRLSDTSKSGYFTRYMLITEQIENPLIKDFVKDNNENDYIWVSETLYKASCMVQLKGTSKQMIKEIATIARIMQEAE